MNNMENSENKIEAVIICYGYLDFLSLTLPKNLDKFDHFVIVTKPGDPLIEFCNSLKTDKITIIETKAMHHNGAQWNKGLCIAIGLQHLKYNKFFCTIDSDVLVPEDFREQFFNFAADKQLAYGSRRFLINSRAELKDFESGVKTEKDFLLLRGFLYGFFAIFHCESKSYQNFVEQYNAGYIYWIPYNGDIDWRYLRFWGAAEMKYVPEPKTPYPDFHYDQNNDYITGLAKQLPFNVAHLGDPGQQEQTKKTVFE